MDLGLKGKKALVTGAHAALVAPSPKHSRTKVPMWQSVREPGASARNRRGAQTKGCQCHWRYARVADGPALKAWIAEAGQALGGIDILSRTPARLRLKTPSKIGRAASP